MVLPRVSITKVPPEVAVNSYHLEAAVKTLAGTGSPDWVVAPKLLMFCEPAMPAATNGKPVPRLRGTSGDADCEPNKSSNLSCDCPASGASVISTNAPSLSVDPNGELTFTR